MGRIFLIYTALFTAVSFAQFAPLGSGFENGTQVLMFVASDCPVCEELSTHFSDLPITYIAMEEGLSYEPLVIDSTHFLGDIFRVEVAPTVTILQEGQQVKKYVDLINYLDVIEAVNSVRNGEMRPEQAYNVSLGDVLSEDGFANYTRVG